MASRRMPNGVDRARVVRRKDVSFRRTKGNIAAIDFGTKNCSLAYVTGGDAGVSGNGLNKLPLNGPNCRVPTAILLDAEKKVVAFGIDARGRYANLDAQERKGMYYFDGIKINLQRDKNVGHDVRVRALNGTVFKLVDVISYILGYLKREFLETHLHRGGHTFSADDFDWVVTVPAIWRASGKQMMREAAKLAGLCSEQSPDQLSLALEPESGAIYCHEMLKYKKVAYPGTSISPLPSSYSYIIVDVGGGTVDVSAHRVTTIPSLSVEELHHPVGNEWGGLQVNSNFSVFLQELIKDRYYTRYLPVNDAEVRITNRFELDEMLNDCFEKQKQMFGRTKKEDRHYSVVKLPDSFLNIYRDTLQSSLKDLSKSLRAANRHDEIVELKNCNLRIPPVKMEQFLQLAVDGIMKCIQDLLKDLLEQNVHVDVFYLVGGFGGCPYIYEKFQEKYGSQCRIVVPPNPEYAIVEGAVLFRANPAIVRCRKADATYGKSVVREFEKIHDPKYKDGNFCQHLFQTIVGVGETLNADSVYVATSRPLQPDQPKIHFEIFSSTKEARELWYTRGSDVILIGELELEFPEVGKSCRNREVEIQFDFSHTEIQVRAYDKISQAEVKTVLDFLSAIPPEQQRVQRAVSDQHLEKDQEDGGGNEENKKEDGQNDPPTHIVENVGSTS